MRILLVEDGPLDARLVEEMLARARSLQPQVTHVMRLADALAHLKSGSFDVILLDLSLPDSRGLETLQAVLRQAPYIAIVVLTALADEEISLAAVQQGAQDYLLKGEASVPLLARTLRHAVERKQGAADLRRREEWFRALVQKASDVITVVDAAGTIVYESPAVARVLGYEPAQRTGHDAFAYLHPDDVELARSTFRQLLADPTFAPTLELRVRHQEGGWRNLEVQATNLLQNSAVEGIVVNARDISERRRAQEAQAYLAAIVSSAHDAVIGMALDQAIVSWNSAAQRMFGYTAEGVSGQPVSLLLPDEGGEGALRLERVAQGEAIRDVEMKWRHKNGYLLPVLVSVSPIENSRGELIGISAIVRDITELKQAHEEIRRLNAQLEDRVAQRTEQLAAANRELEAFAYSVSHDLRAPLRVISGFADILLTEYATEVPDGAGHYLERIGANADKMNQLVEDLLALSRLSRQELHREKLDPAALAQQVLQDLHPQNEERSVEINVEPLAPCCADPRLLRHVYLNLLDNALKYTRTCDVARIRVGAVRQEGQWAYFVADNGVGFNPRYASKLFDVFQRLHAQEAYEGSGVGLAIAQRIVHRHGGRIWAESEVGQGATFYFTLGDDMPCGD